MKCPCEMLQNLPFFIYTKTQSCFFRFHIYKIWQILKRFTGTFHRAQTLKLWGVIYTKYNHKICKFQISCSYFKRSWNWKYASFNKSYVSVNCIALTWWDKVFILSYFKQTFSISKANWKKLLRSFFLKLAWGTFKVRDFNNSSSTQWAEM